MRIRIRPGMERLAQEWMELLNTRKDECLATLDRENTMCEAVFWDRDAKGNCYMLWFANKGMNPIGSKKSNHSIDAVHNDYWIRCVDPDYVPETYQAALDLLHPAVLLQDSVGVFAAGTAAVAKN